MGVAAGYARGWALFGSNGLSSLFGFGGILAGAQLGHLSGPPYLGFVYGRRTGILRPEVAKDYLAQAVLLDKLKYLVGASTFEPRIRLRIWNADAMLGMGATLGYGDFDQCFLARQDGPKSFDALHIVAGIAIGLD